MLRPLLSARIAYTAAVRGVLLSTATTHDISRLDLHLRRKFHPAFKHMVKLIVPTCSLLNFAGNVDVHVHACCSDNYLLHDRVGFGRKV